MVTEEELSNMSQEEIAEMQKKNCIFCKIVDGEVPSKKVYEDDKILAILDIRPATKGHVVVLPKQHYPILPLVPDEVSSHMFEKTKDLCEAVRQGVPAMGTTVFIANGAAAGQQSPHFLYHIIPREANDGLDGFNIEGRGIDQTKILEALRKNVGAMMKSYLSKKGMMPGQEQQGTNEKLAMVLEQNPQIKQALIEDPEEFKKAISANPQLNKLFQGVDIDKLAAKLGAKKKPTRTTQDQEPPVKKAGDGKEKSRGEQKKDKDEADLDKVSRLFK